MKKIKSLVYIFLLVFLAGCGRKEVEYIEDTATEDSNLDVSMDNVYDKIGCMDTWEEIIDAEKGKKINAEVIVPEVRGMKIIDVENTDYVNNPQNQENFITNITKEQVYYYDFERVPKIVIEKELEDIQERIETYEANGDPVDSWYEQYRNEQERYEKAPEDYVPVVEYDTYKYLFSYNDMNYTIEFYNTGHGKGDLIHMELHDSNQVFGEVDEDTYISVQEDSYLLEDNRCSMSLDEAHKLAKEFVDGLDVGEFSNACTNYIKCYCYKGDLEEIYNDGYIFHFTRTIDGISADGNMYTNNQNIYNEAVDTAKANGLILDEYSALEYEQTAMEEIIIYINDKGILDMTYHSPATLGEKTTDNVALLSFDNVKKSFSYVIDEKDYYDYTNFTHMELTYFYYHDYDAKKVVILPVWRLTDEEPTNMFLSYDAQCIMVNAVDGSVIDIGSQLYNTRTDIY